jgi:TPR repeat protein
MKAALQNHANSMYFVAHAYRTGVGAVMNEAAALEWYHKAADAGSSKARLVLQSWPDRGFELPAQTTDNALISEATRTLHRQQ